ncbi:aldose 1-epimerase family protein [Falsiroseomonas sp. CW058]|uniref:aldose 1-epimerase family protein n=1 Tax=Falsiroseomonas sp. CW058 TaxID=3388664 RepID=UPI003D31F45B
MTERVTLSARGVTAQVKALGAELCSLKDAGGREFLWQAGQAWPRHAPILFPVVGRLHDDALDFGGQHYPMGQHGFARDLPFRLVEQRADSARFLLADSEATWGAYPFPFRLEVAYALRRNTVSIGWRIDNPGETLLPCSIGAHPAFRWPLPGAGSKPAHRIEFEQDETRPVYRPGADGLLDPTPRELPLNGRNLGLREELFAEGALVLLDPASRHLRYCAPGAPAVELAWQGMGQLGLWMKPGGDFLCIEPWAGHADIQGYRVEAWHKPGMLMIGPGESRHFAHRITLD